MVLCLGSKPYSCHISLCLNRSCLGIVNQNVTCIYQTASHSRCHIHRYACSIFRNHQRIFRRIRWKCRWKFTLVKGQTLKLCICIIFWLCGSCNSIQASNRCIFGCSLEFNRHLSIFCRCNQIFRNLHGMYKELIGRRCIRKRISFNLCIIYKNIKLSWPVSRIKRTIQIIVFCIGINLQIIAEPSACLCITILFAVIGSQSRVIARLHVLFQFVVIRVKGKQGINTHLCITKHFFLLKDALLSSRRVFAFQIHIQTVTFLISSVMRRINQFLRVRIVQFKLNLSVFAVLDSNQIFLYICFPCFHIIIIFHQNSGFCSSIKGSHTHRNTIICRGLNIICGQCCT